MWPQTASGGRLASIASRIACAAQVVAGARLVAVALGRGVHDQHRALRAAGELLGGLLLVEVEAPVPGRDRDPGAEAEELRAVDLGALAVQDGRGLPALARGAQRVLGLVVARDEDRRCGDRLSASMVSSRPSWTEAKSPAAITTSASEERSTSCAAWPRSRCRSLKASSFTRGSLPSPARGVSTATRRVGMSPGRR